MDGRNSAREHALKKAGIRWKPWHWAVEHVVVYQCVELRDGERWLTVRCGQV